MFISYNYIEPDFFRFYFRSPDNSLPAYNPFLYRLERLPPPNRNIACQRPLGPVLVNRYGRDVG